MNGLAILVAFGLGLAVAAQASACRIAPPPFVPLRGDHDAIALATVTGEGPHFMVLRFDEALYGRLDRRTMRVSDRPGPGEIFSNCGPPRPVLRTGARVVVALYRHEGRQRAAGWTTLEAAAQADQFFALYRRALAPSARRRLRARWREVTRHGGPVPLSDPGGWMAPHAGALGSRAAENSTQVYFRVADDGRVIDCSPYHSTAPAPRDGTICARLERQRFKPPLLSRERIGMYAVRWRETSPPDR
jgi:hypothetical protein